MRGTQAWSSTLRCPRAVTEGGSPIEERLGHRPARDLSSFSLGGCSISGSSSPHPSRWQSPIAACLPTVIRLQRPQPTIRLRHELRGSARRDGAGRPDDRRLAGLSGFRPNQRRVVRCNAGGPYGVTCAGPRTSVTLNGAGSSDPDGNPISYTWTGPFIEEPRRGHANGSVQRCRDILSR